ncbi:hypothetical protein CR513_61600, partial [Mucuna pruriens]
MPTPHRPTQGTPKVVSLTFVPLAFPYVGHEHPRPISSSGRPIEHPQSNGQAEAINKVTLRGLQRRLEEAKGRWAKELPQVLWSYHTTQETPICLTFGTDVMIPIKVRESSPRTTFLQPVNNEKGLKASLDLLQEEHKIVHAKAARRHNTTIFPQPFRKDNLVLRRVLRNTTSNKLSPNWEGPFRILEEVGQGAFKLEHLDRRRVPCT